MCSPCCAFRARAGAAPLKPKVGTAVAEFLDLTFRARAGAAPLKRCAKILAHDQLAAFRARAGAAPLKQSQQ